MGFGVWGLGFGVWGLGFGVSGPGILASGAPQQDAHHTEHDAIRHDGWLKVRAASLRLWSFFGVLGFRVCGFGFGAWGGKGLGLGVWGFRAWGLGHGV